MLWGSMSNEPEKKNRITKELALAITPIAAAFLFVIFYEAGFSYFFGIPSSLIKVHLSDVVLTNRMTLIIVAVAFLWIGLYYNVLPSANSALFKGIITFILLLIFFLGYQSGNWEAKNRQDYLVLSTNPELVVLRIYGDNAVAAPFNRQAKTIEKEFTVHKVGDDPKLEYRWETIGPLTTKD